MYTRSPGALRTDFLRRASMLSLSIGLAVSCLVATAGVPSDRYFSAPPGAPAGATNYQWGLHPGWMNFTEAWDYNTGTARIAINDGGTMPWVGNEYARPYYGSWDFTARAELTCVDPVHDGCSAAGQAIPVPLYQYQWANVPRYWNWGQNGDTDRVVQGHTVVPGMVYNYETQAWQSGLVYEFNDVFTPDGNLAGQMVHGTHVYSVIKAAHNNDNAGPGGVAGACPGCQALATRTPQDPYIDAPPRVMSGHNNRGDALNWMIRGGAQVVSVSYGGGTVPDCAETAVPDESEFCAVLRLARARDVLFFGAAGNNLGTVGHPGRDPMAIAVGGTDIQKRLWDERLFGYQDGDHPSGCPLEANPGDPYGTLECGSASGPELDFVGPARRVLGLVPPGQNYGGSYPLCGDRTFGTHSDGVGYCTGTSMATPLVAAAGALIRSVNPLLKRDSVYDALKQTADGGQVFSSRGWGMPNAGAAVKRVLGQSAGLQVQNRLTPLFVMKTSGDRLYTVVPQLAVASYTRRFVERPYRAYDGSEYAFGNGAQPPDLVAYNQSTATEAALVRVPSTNSDRGGSSAYAYPAYPGEMGSLVPRSAFHVFTGHRPMFGVAMKPLTRLLSVANCDSRETSFEWKRNCPDGGARQWVEDGIEGYLLQSCPAQFAGCNNPADPSVPQAVYLRYSSLHKSFALLLDSQLLEPQFASYEPLHPQAAAALGYAFKNVDSDLDGLIDGMELVLGTNRLLADSDCDGLADGTEYPALTLQTGNQDPRIGPCGNP